jgi:cysteine desulfurase
MMAPSLNTPVYLDYNAMAPLRPEVKQAMETISWDMGNPSSIHGWGRKARSLLEDARARIASLLGARPEEVIWTSGGTEGNMLALQGLSPAIQKIYVGATEHLSVTRQACPSKLEIVPVNRSGQVEEGTLRALLAQAPGAFLCSVLWAHNETGVLNDIQALSALTKARGGFFHTDAIQAVGRLPLSFRDLSSVDLLTVSSHKIGGPPGIGALLVREDVPLVPLMRGGGQERGLRSGTPNVALAQGFAVALACALRDPPQSPFQSWLEAQLPEDSIIFGQGVPRLPNTSCFTMPGVKAETQLIALDFSGIMVSSGAACSSGKTSLSPSLLAMGTPVDVAETALRVSTGWNTKQEDLVHLMDAWNALYHRLHPSLQRTSL